MDFGTSGFRSLNELAAELQRLAEEKGFRENIGDPRGKEAVEVYVANFHGEASELWEAARGNRLHKPCDKSEQMRAAGLAPMTCLEEETADMIIRPLDIGNIFTIDIDGAKRRYDKDWNTNGAMTTGVAVYDMATYVNGYHAAATSMFYGVTPYRVATMLNIAFHICNVFGLSPIDIVMRKHAFNKTRPHRHGGKLV